MNTFTPTAYSRTVYAQARARTHARHQQPHPLAQPAPPLAWAAGALALALVAMLASL